MADIKLFSIKNGIKELESSTVNLEKELQTMIENNMETFFGVKFLATEYVTSNGRMDSLGIDENHCPVIFEYKRDKTENVINQGLFYLDWLLDHKDSFKVLVLEKLGKEDADKIDWSMPRIICVAYDFTKYDKSAINQMTRNISLIRYRKYGNDYLMFEKLNENIVSAIEDEEEKKQRTKDKTYAEQYESCSPRIRDIVNQIQDYTLQLGDEVSGVELKLYKAFKKIRNFACIVLQESCIVLYLKLDPSFIELEDGFTRDVTHIGHWGTGNLEVTIKTQADFEKSKSLIEMAYDEN